VALFFAAMFFNSIVSIQAGSQVFIYSIFGLHIKDVKALNIGIYTTFLLGLTSSIVALTAYSISLFKNRIKQMTMVRFNTLLILLFVLMMFLGLNKSNEVIALETKSEIMNSTYLFGIVIPFVALILNILGYRGIKKDEELVRSADRLR
jgi:heme/copper-type cytochrome/quinol oxidase subunit 3